MEQGGARSGGERTRDMPRGGGRRREGRKDGEEKDKINVGDKEKN